MIAPTRRRGGLRRRARGGLRRARRFAGRHKVGIAGGVGTLIIGALAVGYAKQKGYLAKLPKLGGMPAAASVAAAGWALNKYAHNRTLKAAGVVGMIVGAFDFAVQQAGGTSGLEGDTEGDTEGDAEGDDTY
jgi:hypothetical protein